MHPRSIEGTRIRLIRPLSKDIFSFLQKRLLFKNKALLWQALTHSSYAHLHNISDNERLEFLGDAILSAIVAETLCTKFPTLPEGELTKLRAQCVQGKSLAAAARKLDLQPNLRHTLKNPSVKTLDNLLEQAFEAIVGACFIELGYEKTKKKVLSWLPLLTGDLADTSPSLRPAKITAFPVPFNPKGMLQELLQPKVPVEGIEYRLCGVTGPDHDRKFTVELYIKGKLIASGVAGSKKAAQEMAATEGLKELQKPTAKIPSGQ